MKNDVEVRPNGVRILTVKVSVMDVEPVSELVDIITGYPKDKLPKDLHDQLEQWCDKYTSDDD